MSVLMAIGVLLVLFMVGGMLSARKSGNYQDQIRQLVNDRIKLQMRVGEMEEELGRAKTRQAELETQVTRIMTERDNLLVASTQRGPTGSTLTIVDVLVSSGVLTAEGLQKAKDYKVKTKSPYSIEEILVLLDLVSPDEIRFAQQRARS